MFNFDLEEEPSIDLTPLIDTIFMLLIFFIMTTTFSRPVLDIILPSSKEAQVSNQKREQVISIKADGSIYYEGSLIEKGEIDAILEKMPDALLNLYVDQKAPFEAFVGVVDIAKVKKGGHFVISTQQNTGR